MKYFSIIVGLAAPFCNGFTAPLTPSVTSPRSSTSLNAMPDGGVVITGSAGGVGFAYAGEFMDRGYDVVICDVKDCAAAAKALTARHPNGRVFHTQCDVSDAASCEKLGKFSQEKLGKIGYWINNAGINGGRRALSELSMQQVETVVKVNLLGIFYCTKVAMDIMAEQEGFTGHIFNTVGSGVKGGGTPGYATYGATKRGLPQLTASLVKEIDEGVQGYEKKQTKGTIQVHSLSPGMVFTKLLLDNSTPGKCLASMYNIIDSFTVQIHSSKLTLFLLQNFVNSPSVFSLLNLKKLRQTSFQRSWLKSRMVEVLSS